MAMEKQGQYAKLYVGTAGGTASPTPTTEVTLVTTVTLDASAEEVDNTTRANAGYQSTDVGNKDWTLNFSYQYKTAQTQLNTIRDAYNDQTAIGIKALTGSGTLDEGPNGDWVISQHSRNENINERIVYDVVARLYANPEWVEPST